METLNVNVGNAQHQIAFTAQWDTTVNALDASAKNTEHAKRGQ